MLGKLILKIVVKASLPVVALAGVLSYGLYLKGGDPLSMWSTIASRTMGTIRESGTNTLQSVQEFSPSVLASSLSNSKTRLFTWVDANGTTHFGSSPPVGVAATAMTIQSNTTSESPATRTIPRASAAMPDESERLPGMAGVKLPIDVQPEHLGLSREELLKMIGQ